ncbi:hypothetical protein ASE67_02500 [Sphingomonas sp. Leaf23]|uniref:hypothetical protein n=1 Tax=Sphingomonas sp. Leaf23 TaxID=1735689 RepID=UPI0006F333EA|nr:hypothetical protein [Sphingomonas sp. Leaf23]KQM88630.1 hypothetical protein ASE67_02500 [Sphingomonas sp. Leaf23]
MGVPQNSDGLPVGYELEQDIDGDWVLIPPADVTIFSMPGEGWLVAGYYMNGRDWDSRADVVAACRDYLAAQVSA